MSFHSFQFIFVFIPIVVAVYGQVGRISLDAAKAWLILASFVFYGWGAPEAIPVLVFSILFNYQVATRLDPDNPQSGRWLRVALTVNLLMLVVFKYSGFAASNVNALLGTTWTVKTLLLPLGISFFTVQQIMFLVDRHEGVAPKPRFLDYVFFVSWFPYIVAGPITRWTDVIPALSKGMARLNEENLTQGTALFLFGLGKKVIVSGAFAPLVEAGYQNPAGLGFLGAWLATAAFGFQLYFDFSGYTDMARGVALMMNVALPQNFNDPFRALSITDFWQRWHISLTNFITTYIYTPILRARRPNFRRATFATIVTMTIAGVWHGAGWGLALMGLWHGLGLAAHKAWVRDRKRLPDLAAWAVTAAFVLVGFAFFRGHSVGDAFTIIRWMLVPTQMGGLALAKMVGEIDAARLVVMLAGIAVLFHPASAWQVAEQANQRPRLAAALAVCLFVCLLYMNSQPQEGFIYRQF